jgi:hypothetical protein
MQRVVLISYWRFGTVGPIFRVQESKMSAINYHYSLRNDSEERISHLLRGGSLKSRSTKVHLQKFLMTKIFN